jgi:hypothetical protein
LNKFDRKVVQSVVSYKFCTILLTNGVHYIEELVRIGLLKEDEAEHLESKKLKRNLTKLCLVRPSRIRVKWI